MTITPRSTLIAQAETTLPDNETRDISEEDVRDMVQDMMRSTLIPYYREVTDAGAVTVGDDDHIIGVNKTSGEATNVNLGLAAARSGFPITIKDVKGDAGANNITPVASGGELCDGLALSGFTISTNYGSRTFYPREDGWYTLS